jgi:hypothetical protein
MKQLLIFLLLLTALGASAQTARIKFKQIATGNNGQVAMVGVDGNGAWVTPPFMVYTDTANLIATKSNVNVALLKEITSASFTNGVLTLTKANGNTVTVSLDGRYILSSTIGQPNGVAPIGADGKIPSTYLPAQTGRSTFVDASQTQMLGHTAVAGDMSIRTDENKTYVLQSLPANNVNNWVELPSQTAPVTSVNGFTGNVSISTSNVAEGTNQYFTIPRARTSFSASAPINYNSTTGAFTHATSGVNAGTYNNVTVDAFGHVTSGAVVPFVAPSDLSNYYTKTNLQTPGQAVVSWDNINGKPTTFAGQEEAPQFTGATTNSIVLPHTPVATTAVKVFLNGQLLNAADYTQSGTTITLGFTREATDVIKAVYNF